MSFANLVAWEENQCVLNVSETHTCFYQPGVVAHSDIFIGNDLWIENEALMFGFQERKESCQCLLHMKNHRYKMGMSFFMDYPRQKSC